MKTAMIMIVVLFAFAANASADPFADSKVWKQFTNVENRSVYVEKFGSKIYVNSFLYDLADGNQTFIYSNGKKNVARVVCDKFSNAWVISDSTLICQGADTTLYTAAKNGFPHGFIRTVFCDNANARLIIGTDNGIGISSVDFKGHPTTWANALSVSIHQFAVSKNADVWAINNKKVYRFTKSVWDSGDAHFGTPISGDFDLAGNFWITFNRTTAVAGETETGLAKFDGQSWSEHFVGTENANFFGRICIDRDNTLWFSGDDAGIGSVNLSTMTVSRIPAGTYSWNPLGQTVAISKDENGYVIYSGAGAGVFAIAPSAVRTPAVVRTVYRGSEKVVGTFDLAGRKIVNSNSFSAHSSGMRFVAVQTSQGIVARKVLSTH